MKCVILFRKKGKLSSHYIQPFENLEKVAKVPYQLALPPKLSMVYDIFHMSMIKRYILDPTYVLTQEPLEVNQELSYKEKLVYIPDKKEKELR